MISIVSYGCQGFPLKRAPVSEGHAIEGQDKNVQADSREETAPEAEPLAPALTVEEPLTQTELAVIEHLDRGEEFMARGECKKAREEIFLVIPHSGVCRPELSVRALKIFMEWYKTSKHTSKGDAGCAAYFNELEATCSDSMYGPAAPCWLQALYQIVEAQDDRKKLKTVIRAQREKIKTLEKQIEQLKAVDLELETEKPSEPSHE